MGYITKEVYGVVSSIASRSYYKNVASFCWHSWWSLGAQRRRLVKRRPPTQRRWDADVYADDEEFRGWKYCSASSCILLKSLADHADQLSPICSQRQRQTRWWPCLISNVIACKTSLSRIKLSCASPTARQLESSVVTVNLNRLGHVCGRFKDL